MSDIQLYGAIAASALIIILPVILIIRYLRKTAAKRSIAKTIDSISRFSIHQVAIPDGIDNYLTIDYCFLTSKGIGVLTIQNYPGLLFGGDTIDHWTQVYQHKSYKFENPLRFNDACVSAIKQILPGIEVAGRVVFSNAGEFAKGQPNGVSMLNQLKNDLDDFIDSNEPSDRLKEQWRHLEALAWSGATDGRTVSTKIDPKTA